MAGTSFLSISVCVLALCNNVLHPLEASPAKDQPGSTAKGTGSGTHAYGTLSNYPFRPLVQGLNCTVNKLIDDIADAYRRFIRKVPGTHPDDTSGGGISETVGSDSPITQLATPFIAQYGLVNDIVDRLILYRLFGGIRPEGEGKQSLNEDNSNQFFTDFGGNSISVPDRAADHALERLAGKGNGTNKNKSSD